MKKQLKEESVRLLKTIVPAKVIQSRLHKRVFMHFAEKAGLVYFGFVDQRDDEHKLVRGLTVSAHHRDNHYCVGSFDGYDIALVERTDTIRFPGKPAKNHTWVIMTFDLHTPVDVPHIFIGLHTHSDTFYAHLFTKFNQLTRLPFEVYDPQFTQRYTVYTQPAHYGVIEQLLNPQITKAIGEHFGSLTVEVVEGCVYIYAEHQRPTPSLLEKMLRNGLWLARVIDERFPRV